MKDLSQEKLKALQNTNLEMAKYFVDFCQRHDLLCYFCGGGCIGAIRHHGFIPWDDDLDFFMPRQDYDKLLFLWNKYANMEHYSILKSGKKFVDHNLFITIRDNYTTMIKPYQAHIDMPHGVAMDIIPLDGYPDGRFQRKKQCVWALLYSLYCSQMIPQNHGRIVKIVGKLALALVPSRKIRYYIWKYAEKQMKKYRWEECSGVTELCTGPGYMKNWYPKEAFLSAIWVPFEDTKMPVPVGYDVYLKTAFGDYMKLPPKKSRKTHHDAIIIDLNNSYVKYRMHYGSIKKRS